MDQLTQKLKDGQMQISEVPIPYLQKGYLLVKSHYFLISAGSESITVKGIFGTFLHPDRQKLWN